MLTTEQTALVRQWMLLRTLGARRLGITVNEMVAEFGISARTAQRDIATLQRLGFPIVEKEITAHGCKHWELSQESNGVALNFAWDEAIAIYLARNFLDPLAGSPIWESLTRVYRKVRACLGEEALKYLDKMRTAFHHTKFGAGDYSKKAAIIDSLMLAIEDRKLTLLSYHSLSSTEAFTYEIFPLGIVYHKSHLYLVAFSSDHQEIRHFKIDRIEAADPQAMKFPPPKDFDLGKHLESSFGVFQGKREPYRVRVRFHADVARIVEESRWHHSQKLIQQPDGSLLAEFALSDLTEFKSWILSFGGKVVVLEPRELRERVLQAAEEIVRALSEWKEV